MTSRATSAPELLPKTIAGWSVRCEGLAPDIIGIGREPVIRVLRAVEQASGKTAAVVGHHLVLCRKCVCERAEDLSYACCSWNQDQEWPGTCDLIRQLG